ncbi:DUF998 domain-containing protein [Glycomyces artemisiae]|uniref:Uncharacterized protein DUF998 n=1 Tax=Glycomyces artemisiae TaxID=1076443 RepID=A0A2T0USI1_9ACTN|nr:DUF998 domain-containing protein [Glycomyces artemisiae]PRY60892.1 uncharacterized protein DUF998 [Glycomyces artemisiae]
MSTPASPARTARTGLLALGAVAAPVLFTLAWVILSLVSDGYTIGGDRISPYSNLTQPISGLGLGTTAPYMNTAFVLSGVLLAAGLVGFFRIVRGGRAVWRRISLVGLGLAPVGLVLIGLFDLESPGLHFLGVVLAFQLPFLVFIATGLHLRGVDGFRRLGTVLLTVAVPLTLIGVVLFQLTFDEAATADGEGVAGLTQRLWLTEVWCWFAVLGWAAWRAPKR